MSEDASATTPRWRRRRGLRRYREFVVYGVLLCLVVALLVAERLSPSPGHDEGFILATPSLDWTLLVLSALLAEATVVYAAARAFVYLGRDRAEARTRTLLTIAAAGLLVLVFWILWPREHVYTRASLAGWTGPPVLGFLVAESDVERRLKAFAVPEDGIEEGVDGLTVYRAFANRGGTPYVGTGRQSESYATIHLLRSGEAPLDLSVQIASSPSDVLRSEAEFEAELGDACAAPTRGTAPALLTRANISVLVNAPCPGRQWLVRNVPGEIALVREVLDSLTD